MTCIQGMLTPNPNLFNFTAVDLVVVYSVCFFKHIYVCEIKHQIRINSMYFLPFAHANNNQGQISPNYIYSD